MRRFSRIATGACAAFVVALAGAGPASSASVSIGTPLADHTYYNSPNAVPQFHWNYSEQPLGDHCNLDITSPYGMTLFAGGCLTADAGGPTWVPSGEGVVVSWSVAQLLEGDGTYRMHNRVDFVDGPIEFERTFTLDSALPQVRVEAPTGFTASRSPEVGFEVDEANPGTTRCGVDASGPGDLVRLGVCAQNTMTLPTLADGQHSFWAVHSDLAGNTGYAMKSFVVDTTAPSITVAGVEHGQVVRQSSIQLAVGALDAGVGVGSLLCSWDGSPASSCEEEQFKSVELVDDVYQLLVIAVDKLGNVASHSLSFVVETEVEDDEELETPLTPPSTVRFKVTRGALKKRRYHNATLSASFQLPADAERDDCEGTARMQVKQSRKLLGRPRLTFSVSGRTCSVRAKLKINKKYRRKKLKLTLDYASGPFQPFKRTSRSIKF